ncbi:MAG: addiction module antidote protein, HigA family [Chloroflexi bacterium RBG_16_57_9]|nr:MAG: addiction module antidote protein, HigA family [Chloroflexi bacterium RBG_16_57_9]
MPEEKMTPVHPGEILLEDFMKPLGISQYRLAKAMHVYPRKINEIIQGKRSITADTALRLARFFGTSAEVWMNLQAHYDLELAKDALEEIVAREVMPYRDLCQTGQVPQAT